MFYSKGLKIKLLEYQENRKVTLFKLSDGNAILGLVRDVVEDAVEIQTFQEEGQGLSGTLVIPILQLTFVGQDLPDTLKFEALYNAYLAEYLKNCWKVQIQ